MAIFLLIYIIIFLVWLIWASIITYIILRYRYPDKIGVTALVVFLAISAVIILLSVIFIARADWVTVPELFKSATATI